MRTVLRSVCYTPRRYGDFLWNCIFRGKSDISLVEMFFRNLIKQKKDVHYANLYSPDFIYFDTGEN